jgi:hypothetical protein
MTTLENSKEHDPIHGHFFFIDIVGLSDPEKGTTESQIEKIKVLHKCIGDCVAFNRVSDDKKYVNLTGDGMVIGFLEGPALPLDLAIELHRKLGEYNKKRSSRDKIGVRIGIDSAPIKFYQDILGKENVWGDGIILAKRVMDLGDAGHILLSSRSAQGLSQFAKYKDYIHEVGQRRVKHGVTIVIYGAYGSDFGNPVLPKDNDKINDDQNSANEIKKGPKYWLTALVTAGFFDNPQPIREIHERLASESHFYNLTALTKPLDDMVKSNILRKIKMRDKKERKVWHWVKW